MLQEPAVIIEGMSKWFGTFQVLDRIDLTVQPGEKIVICGPSGSRTRNFLGQVLRH